MKGIFPTMGMRLPLPNALGLTLSTGAVWCLLNSLVLTSFNTFFAFVKAHGDDVLWITAHFNVLVKDGIQNLVGGNESESFDWVSIRQKVVLDGVDGYDFFFAIDVCRQFVDFGFIHVTQY